MAVYTKIISKDIHLINSNFNIDEIKSFQGIKKGIENTNYLLKTKNEMFILTIFEKRVSNKEIPFFIKLMDDLNQSKISCPKPLKDKNRNFLFKLKNKTACVVTFLKGKDKQILNTNNCYQIGKIISKMHSITKKLKFSRKNSMGIQNLNTLLKSIKFKAKKNSNLEKFLAQNLSNIKKSQLKSLKTFQVKYFLLNF